ncbi:MAG: YwiC-like family protein [Candidatus Hydrogenedentes bacterium]|nr:YwiC-like family protein [Candidatus Hydrogenedentota bacterium]
MSQAGTMNEAHPRTDNHESMWRWRYAVPPEKGAWIWWIGPLLIGAAAARQVHWDLILLIVAALCAFLVRQPLTLAVKIVWRGRSRAELAPVLKWAALYSVLTLAAAGWLLGGGHGWVLWMAAVGGPLFAWHLYLVRQGQERHQVLLDLLAAAFLALTAPAAYWAAHGVSAWLPWTIWLLTFLQSSASIVHMMLRLEQRRHKTAPSDYPRWRTAALPLMHHQFNLVLGIGFYAAGHAPLLVPIAFGLLLLDALEIIARPPFGHTPKQLGMRQLFVGSSFVVLLMAGYAFFG